MKRDHLNFETYKKELLKNSKVKSEYDRLQPEFALIETVLKARREKGLTQMDLAKKVGTKQTAISRLEKGKANPSINFLKKIAAALGTRLEIRFVS